MFYIDMYTKDVDWSNDEPPLQTENTPISKKSWALGFGFLVFSRMRQWTFKRAEEKGRLLAIENEPDVQRKHT